MIHPEVLHQKDKLLQYINSLGIDRDQIKDIHNILLAFVHKSFASDYKEDYEHNERLEFLGDGILGAIINKFLFLDFPNMAESQLTLYKISFVREETLADVARDIKLGDYIFISKGEERSHGRNKNSILSDTLEALIGALYIELGVETVEIFIKKYLYTKLDKIKSEPSQKSYKTQLQELTQKRFKQIPIYKDTESEISETGNVTQYKSEIFINGQKEAEGFGVSKKKAQEFAAKTLYKKWTDTNNG